MKEHVRQEMEAEDKLWAALSHYGPTVYGGKVWQTSAPPRTSRVLAFKFQFARDLPWPPQEAPLPSPPEPKLAGYGGKETAS